MDISEHTATLPICPECDTPVGEYHDLGCSLHRCPACGQQKPTCGDSGQIVWTGGWPDKLHKQNGVHGYGVLLGFSPNDGHLNRERHQRHNELVAEVVTILGSDRCSLDSVQMDDDDIRYVFFVEPGVAPTEDHFDGLGEKYGPFMVWLTTHNEDSRTDETVDFLVS